MATSYSDMMNDPTVVYALSDDKSASMDMHSNQMMTSPVAPDSSTSNGMMYPDIHHMPGPAMMTPGSMLYKQNHASLMNVADATVASQFLQNHLPASFHHPIVNSSVTPAPIVKSQAVAPSPAGFYSMAQPTAGFVYPHADYAQHHQLYQPEHVLPPHQHPHPPQQHQQHISSTATTSPMAVDSLDGFQALQQHPDLIMTAGMYPPLFPETSANVPPPFLHEQPTAMMNEPHNRRSSAITSADYTAQQQQSQQQPRRQPMPRRHTVSTPYQPPSKGKEPEPELPQAKLRKVLKAKRHRSLGKLNTASTASSEKWMSPDTSSSSSICSPTLSGNNDFEHEQMLLLGNFTQQEQQHLSGATEYEEEEHLQCLWADCFLEMKSLDELISHVKETHIGSGKALYYCNWRDCPRNQKPFTKRHKMHNHLRTHTGERPFECTEPGCGKRFSRPDSLTTHAKIHSNVRPYLCSYESCGKAYYHLRSLRKHERTHEDQQSDAPESSTRQAVPLPGDTNKLLDWSF